jgi:HlyD family secretion protein
MKKNCSASITMRDNDQQSQVVKDAANRPPQTRLLPKRTRFRWAATIAALLLAVAAVLVYRTLSSSPEVQYATASVTEGAVARTVIATGSVNPVLTIIVGSYVSGVIQELTCDYNTQVKKGQICAMIDPRPYQTVVDQTTAALANAKAQLAKDQAALVYAETSHQRNTALRKDGYITQDVLDVSRSALDEARAQITLDHATIAEREAALHAAAINLGYTDIASPVDGTVVSRNVTIGQTVAASFQTPTLFLIATDLTRMQVDANVSESDIGTIKEGDKASISVESFQNRNFDARVVQVRQAPQTVQNVVTYDVVLGVDNVDLLLKPGMTATARIITDARAHVLRVPDQALRFEPTGISSAADETKPAKSRQVWKLRDGRPTNVPVTLGLDDDSYTEVVSGDLKAGDTIIIGERRGGVVTSGTPPRFGP